MPLILISNPVCGSRSGHAFVEQHVLPLLASHNIPIDETVVTNAPGHAGRAAFDFVLKHCDRECNDISIILSSGDGTLHEIVNALLSTRPADQSHIWQRTALSIALVPSGTANALYSTLYPEFEDTTAYRLQAIQAFIREPYKARPLSIAETVIESSDSQTQTIYSAIVTSTSLHASILHDSEILRDEIPDLERFKVAAKNNITRWYNSDVVLLSAENGGVSRYNTRIRDFELVQNETESTEGLHIKGPFTYFTSTVNVDRLEPSFMISSLQSKLPAATACMEIIALRPLRYPSIQGDTPKERESYAEITTAVLSAAYRGEHADLTLKAGAEGIAEYFRCDGWKWIPDDKDDAAHFVCADGSVFRIREGGSATCKLCKMQGIEFRVYY